MGVFDQPVSINVGANIYIKDPQSSSLGRRIVEQGIIMIHELGFEKFTFKKLGERIGSNESSIYRYFESKHKLLLYLTTWYWGWLEYQLVFSTNHMDNPVLRLKTAIGIVTRATEGDSTFSHVNEVMLNRIIIDESRKSYLTKEEDQKNKEGYFRVYNRLVNRIAEMIWAVDPQYAYPQSLASTVIEGALHQHFLSYHFSGITNCNGPVTPPRFFGDLVFGVLKLPEATG